MWVKVGDTLYDDDKLPMMVSLTGKDKYNIRHMRSDCSKYAVFPDGWGDEEAMRHWARYTPPGVGAEKMQTDFNNAINFALDYDNGNSATEFLTLWREGCWPEISQEFPEFVAEYGVPS